MTLGVEQSSPVIEMLFFTFFLKTSRFQSTVLKGPCLSIRHYFNPLLINKRVNILGVLNPKEIYI